MGALLPGAGKVPSPLSAPNPYILDTEVETTRKMRLTKDQLKELIKEVCGLKGKTGVTITFDCCGGDDGYGGWSAMDLSSVSITHTERSKG